MATDFVDLKPSGATRIFYALRKCSSLFSFFLSFSSSRDGPLAVDGTIKSFCSFILSLFYLSVFFSFCFVLSFVFFSYHYYCHCYDDGNDDDYDCCYYFSSASFFSFFLFCTHYHSYTPEVSDDGRSPLYRQGIRDKNYHSARLA